MSKSTKLKISMIQADLAWEQPIRNLIKFERYIETLPATDIVVLPEMFSTGFTMNAAAFAEDMDGPAVAWMKDMSISHSAAICGSLIIKENENYFNRFLFVLEDRIIGQYDKRHLFRMGGENDHYTKGERRVIVKYKGWRIIPQICYDLRFPVWYRNRDDFDLMINIANWPAVRRKVWETLLSARAIENQCYVIGLNRVGPARDGLEHSGNSMVIDYKGDVIESIPDNVEGVITRTIDLGEQKRFRQKFPAHLDADGFVLS